MLTGGADRRILESSWVSQPVYTAANISKRTLPLRQGIKKESAARLSSDLYIPAVTSKGPHLVKSIYMYIHLHARNSKSLLAKRGVQDQPELQGKRMNDLIS